MKKEKILIKEISKFGKEDMERITRNIDKINSLPKPLFKKFISLCLINIQKDSFSEKEFNKSIKEIYTLMTLELFNRLGMVKRNKDGNYEGTELGNELLELELKNQIKESKETSP